MRPYSGKFPKPPSRRLDRRACDRGTPTVGKRSLRHSGVEPPSSGQPFVGKDRARPGVLGRDPNRVGRSLADSFAVLARAEFRDKALKVCIIATVNPCSEVQPTREGGDINVTLQETEGEPSNRPDAIAFQSCGDVCS
jgi:hypothetical protein